MCRAFFASGKSHPREEYKENGNWKYWKWRLKIRSLRKLVLTNWQNTGKLLEFLKN
jgi:hypothetical protein